MDTTIKADLYRYGRLTELSKGKKIPQFKFTYYMRLAAKHKKTTIKGIYSRFMVRKLTDKYGFQISAYTKIGEGFYINHFGTVVINPRAVIGKNCTLTNSVTIGQANRGKRKGTPIIGDNVWIGSGCVIVGKIKIGNNVLIAPNSFVNIDVPDGSLVIGNPAKIVQKDNPTEDYILNTLS